MSIPEIIAEVMLERLKAAGIELTDKEIILSYDIFQRKKAKLNYLIITLFGTKIKTALDWRVALIDYKEPAP